MCLIDVHIFAVLYTVPDHRLVYINFIRIAEMKYIHDLSIRILMGSSDVKGEIVTFNVVES